ncbi:MAG TPA: sensor histidine kinase, partial [Chitinophagales bacterium]|nr:sensor histidine kinase [Chitinophagales bacterium]
DERDELLYKKELAIKHGASDVEANFLSKQNQKFPYHFTSLLSTYNGQPCLLGVGIDIADRKKAQRALLKRTNELNERVKELNCLYRISEISYNRDLSIEQVAEQSLDILASSYQYHENVCVCICFDGVRYHSKKFIETPWMQQADIVLQGQVAGDIRAYYMIEMPPADEGPFLKEERWLINSVARVISTATERKLAEEETRRSQTELRQLSAHLQTVREDERTSIAREIHDELGQQLTGLKMDVSWLKKLTTDSVVLDKLQGMLALIDDTIKTVRRISSDLRPGILDDLGLLSALEWQSNEFEKRTGITSDFNALDITASFSRDVATGVFRIYQESLTNVARHANAQKVSTLIEQRDNELILTITDDGVGFDISRVGDKKTLGLLGMRERALMFNGKLTIESQKQKGTIIILKVPLILY